MDQTILNEMEGNVLEILVKGYFEGNLVKFKSIVGILVGCEFVVTLLILHNLLYVDVCPFQVIRS